LRMVTRAGLRRKLRRSGARWRQLHLGSARAALFPAVFFGLRGRALSYLGDRSNFRRRLAGRGPVVVFAATTGALVGRCRGWDIVRPRHLRHEGRERAAEIRARKGLLSAKGNLLIGCSFAAPEASRQGAFVPVPQEFDI